MKHAKEAGAAAALVVTPYYNRPNQDGLYRHFAYLAEQSDLPIIIYNIPGRAAVDMTVATLARLAAAYPTIIGRSEEHTSELQSLMRISYSVFCLKNKINILTLLTP